MKNNPLIYIDPTGHAECRTEEECEDMGTTPMGTGNPHNGGGGGDDDDDEPDPSDGEPSDLVNNDGTPLPDGYYCQSSTLTCWANFAQDMATTVDFLFAGLEVVLVIGGCVAGPEGCAGGLLTSWMIFNSGPNQIESALSGLSLVLTATEDYREDQKFGESSFTSLVTFIVGGMNPDPIADLVIDGYASGYNHGFFNDISTAIMEGTLLESSPAYK